jgi:DNA-binding LacI/PurR family transcriptional regulator
MAGLVCWATGDLSGRPRQARDDQPRITMVVQPVDDMARVATEFLMERINARTAAIPPREHIFIPRLVVGQSCAPPPR